MNPDSTIRPWILSALKQFGLNQAHDYRWPDAKTRPHVPYCTYQLLRTVPVSSGNHDLSTATGNLVHRKGSKPYHTFVQIDLYNSEDGLYELAALEVAAQISPVIHQLFAEKGVAFYESTITNESEYDDNRIDYHHRMTATFAENVEISIDEINGLVNEIVLDLDFDGDIASRTIDDTGVDITP